MIRLLLTHHELKSHPSVHLWCAPIAGSSVMVDLWCPKTVKPFVRNIFLLLNIHQKLYRNKKLFVASSISLFLHGMLYTLCDITAEAIKFKQDKHTYPKAADLPVRL